MVMIEHSADVLARAYGDDALPGAVIVTDESPATLSPLISAVEATGVRVQVAPPRPWIVDDHAHMLFLRVLCGHLPADAVYELLPLETRASSVINGPASLRVAHNAMLSSNALSDAGVSHARAYGCFSADDAVEHAFALGFPVIVRPAHARDGVGVVECSDPDGVWRVADSISSTEDFAGLVVQQCVPAPADVHVLVAGDDVAGASLQVRSTSAATAWAPVAVGAAISDLAVAAVRSLGGDVMSVHVLVGADGDVLVADVNGAPPVTRFEDSAWERVGAYVAARCRAA